MTIFEGEREEIPRRLSAKELMILYDVKDYNTWKRMIKPISHKLRNFTQKGIRKSRYKYFPREVRYIFDFLGTPIIIENEK